MREKCVILRTIIESRGDQLVLCTVLKRVVLNTACLANGSKIYGIGSSKSPYEVVRTGIDAATQDVILEVAGTYHSGYVQGRMQLEIADHELSGWEQAFNVTCMNLNTVDSRDKDAFVLSGKPYMSGVDLYVHRDLINVTEQILLGNSSL